jgi:hypothetical protein
MVAAVGGRLCRREDAEEPVPRRPCKHHFSPQRHLAKPTTDFPFVAVRAASCRLLLSASASSTRKQHLGGSAVVQPRQRCLGQPVATWVCGLRARRPSSPRGRSGSMRPWRLLRVGPAVPSPTFAAAYLPVNSRGRRSVRTRGAARRLIMCRAARWVAPRSRAARR